MSNNISISVIVPFYNAERYIEKCIKNILNQTYNDKFEVILVNDASTDKSSEIAQKLSDEKFSFYKLNNNLGPSAARNLGLKKAKGEYIYFFDVDDEIEKDTLEILYKHSNQGFFDLIFSDKKWIENSQNQRANTYDFKEDKTFNKREILEIIKKKFDDPISTGKLFGLTGRLIKRSIIIKNQIIFEEKLRYLEDDTFMWDILGHVNNAKYIRKQLYSYYVNPNTKTALAEGIDKGFPVSNFNLVKKHIRQSLYLHNLEIEEINKISEKGFIFFVISALISYSKSIILGKINNKSGEINLEKLIKDILNDKNIKESIKRYKRSSKESFWIPLSIRLRSPSLLKYFCKIRAKQIVNLRKKNL